jgi:hypothetical protein
VGSRLCGGEPSHDNVELVLSSFHSYNKNMTEVATFSACPHIISSAQLGYIIPKIIHWSYTCNYVKLPYHPVAHITK